MLPVIQLGPLAIQLPGLLLLAGAWMGLLLAERYAPRRGIPSNNLYGLVMAAVIVGIIGGRVSFVAQHPAAFASSPLDVISLDPGLLDPFGGLAAGAITVMILLQRKNISILKTLDALTPLLAIWLIATAAAQLASGSAFGAETHLPWGIKLWGVRRHPTQIYSAVLALVVLFSLWPAKKSFQNWPAGRYFLCFTAASAAARLFVEAFRGDSQVIAGGWRVMQIAAWAVLAASLWGLVRISRKNNTPMAAE